MKITPLQLKPENVTPFDPNDHYSIQSAAAFEQAGREGKVVKLPEPNELFIDIDSEADYLFFLEQLARIQQFDFAFISSDTPSSSGLPKRHIVVDLPFDLTTVQRIAWQAALGSDRVREILGLVRANIGDPYPTLFLEKKPEATESLKIDEADNIPCGL